MPKKRTMTQRRDAFFSALDKMRVAAHEEGYYLGCRAAAPEKHDNDEVRAKEANWCSRKHELQRACIDEFNRAVRAAKAR